MKATIYGRPYFYMTITPSQLAILMRLSEMHYDAVCKNASRQGGFLFGWRNVVGFETEHNVPTGQIPPSHVNVSASFSEIDTACKILEMSSQCIGDDATLISEANALAKSFRALLCKANELYVSWKSEINL